MPINGTGTKVTGLTCPRCGDFVYSRARHDFRSCRCGAIFVDGGFDYWRCGWDPTFEKAPESKAVRVFATPEELFQDWNTSTDKFGRIAKQLEWAPGVPHPLAGCQLTLFPMDREH